MRVATLLAAAVALLCLAACGGMREPEDGRPLFELTPDEVADSEPRPEPLLAAGNSSPYQVNGQTYRVMDSSRGYRERGIASWYGSKFHGRKTANGEIFNAYTASAAHRSLPIPCYVRVTNLDNGRSMTVRVNDRGPFHPERIIDLSYAAAVKLGFDQQGTARVEVVALDGGSNPDLRDADADGLRAAGLLGGSPYRYIQVGAFSRRDAADALGDQLRVQVEAPVVISQVLLGDSAFYRVRIGPLDEHGQLMAFHSQLLQLGYQEVRLMPE